jgi:hypothetical protein
MQMQKQKDTSIGTEEVVREEISELASQGVPSAGMAENCKDLAPHPHTQRDSCDSKVDTLTCKNETGMWVPKKGSSSIISTYKNGNFFPRSHPGD